MRKPVLLLILFLFVAFTFYRCTSDSSDNPVANLNHGNWVDLSYGYDEQTIFWPTADAFRIDTVFEGETAKGFYYAAFNFSMAEHGGTHLDAPIHFAAGQKTVDELTIQQLSGNAIVIDVSKQCKQNRDYQITPEDLKQWESTNGGIAEDVIIFFRTGFGAYWPDKEKYMGTTLRGQEGVDNLHFPGIHPECAKWLITHRKIKAVGLDTPSIDFGQSKLFESHQLFFNANIPAFENVANLHLLPVKGSWVMALPLKISGGSGAPVRIAGLLP